jgi:hypothetical protein
MPTGAGPTRTIIKGLCDAALLAIVSGWPEIDPDNGMLIQPLPERQCVSNGAVFWDCEQLVIACERVYGLEGDVAAEFWHQEPQLVGFRGVILAVWLLRCVPDLDVEGTNVSMPSAEDIDNSATTVLGDSVDIFNLLVAAQERGELATCSGLAFQDWTPAGPEGGFGGGVTRVRALLL